MKKQEGVRVYLGGGSWDTRTVTAILRDGDSWYQGLFVRRTGELSVENQGLHHRSLGWLLF